MDTGNEPYRYGGAKALFQLTLLALSTWAVLYARFTFGPLQETMRADLALSDNQIALLLGPGVAIPMSLGAIPIALLAERFSRAHLLRIFLLLTLVSVVLSALASDVTLLFISRLLIGLSLAGVLVAGYAMVGSLYPPAQRGRATMVVALGEISGAPTAFALGGFLLAMSTSVGSHHEGGWRWVLMWMSVPLVPVTVLMLALREPRPTAAQPASPALLDIWPALWMRRGVIGPLICARILVWLADGAVLVWGAPSFSRRFNLSPDRVGGIIAGVLLVAGILGPILGGPIADLCQRKGGPRRTMLAMGVIAALTVPASFFSLMPTVSLATIVLTVFMSLGYTVNVMATALAIIVVPMELRALLVAITVTGSALFCFGVAPVLVSGVSGVLGGPDMIGAALAFVCSVTSLFGGAVFGFCRKHFSSGVGEDYRYPAVVYSETRS